MRRRRLWSRLALLLLAVRAANGQCPNGTPKPCALDTNAVVSRLRFGRLSIRRHPLHLASRGSPPPAALSLLPVRLDVRNFCAPRASAH